MSQNLKKENVKSFHQCEHFHGLMDFCQKQTNEEENVEEGGKDFKVTLMPVGFAWAQTNKNRNQNNDNKSIFISRLLIKPSENEYWQVLLYFSEGLFGVNFVYFNSCEMFEGWIEKECKWVCDLTEFSFL